MARQSELKRHLQNALAELYPARYDAKLEQDDQQRLAEVIEILHDISSGVAR